MSLLTLRFERADRLSATPDTRLAFGGPQAAPGVQPAWGGLHAWRAGARLALLFLHPPSACPQCAGLLAQLSELTGRFALAGARLLVILPAPAADGALPAHAETLPVGLERIAAIAYDDPAGTARSRYAGLFAAELLPPGGVFGFVLNSYGAPYAALTGSDPDDDTPAELLRWVEYMDILCSE